MEIQFSICIWEIGSGQTNLSMGYLRFCNSSEVIKRNYYSMSIISFLTQLTASKIVLNLFIFLLKNSFSTIKFMAPNFPFDTMQYAFKVYEALKNFIQSDATTEYEWIRCEIYIKSLPLVFKNEHTSSTITFPCSSQLNVTASLISDTKNPSNIKTFPNG